MTWTGYDANGNPIAGQSAGVLGVPNGGTGVSTVASGNLLLGAGASPLTALAGSSSGDVVQWNGSAWTAAALTAPLTQIVAPTRLGSSSANIDMTSIPATFYALTLMLELRTDRAGANTDDVWMRFNADSTAGNYFSYGLRIATTTPTTVANQRLGVTATGVDLYYGALAATANTDYLTVLQVTILGYAQTSRVRRVFWDGYSPNTNLTGGLNRIYGGGLWTNAAAAINQITLVPANGTNFVTGSAYALYGTGVAA